MENPNVSICASTALVCWMKIRKRWWAKKSIKIGEGRKRRYNDEERRKDKKKREGKEDKRSTVTSSLSGPAFPESK